MKTPAALTLLALATLASAQSYNIDLGTAGTEPNFLYRASGWQGFWNDIAAVGAGVRVPLKNLNGQATPANYYQIGLGGGILSHDNPLTLGDDEKLMDDMALSFNNPVDGCVWIENLQAGTYDVYIYAMTPNNPALMSSTRVDFTTPPAILVGGTWPTTGHAHGITYSKFTVGVNAGTNFKIGLHSGVPSANIQSGINGIQVVHRDGPPMRVYVDQHFLLSGIPFGGTLASLHKDDADRFFVLFDENVPNGSLELYGFSPDLDPTSFQFELDSSATRSDLTLFLDAWNWGASQFESLFAGASTLAETRTTGTASGALSRFVEAQGGVKARVRWIPTADLEAADGWSAGVDQAGWLIKP